MSSTKATVTFKKKEGVLSISQDKKYVFWTPSTPSGSPPAVTIPVPDIINLQQTPPANPKAALKIFIKDENYVFSFTHATDARKELEAFSSILQDRLARLKAQAAASLAPAASPTPGASGNDGGRPAAMAIARAVSSKATDDSWYDDNNLKADVTLQKSLLESSKALRERFNQSLRDKPDSVSISQFTSQFWAARLHLLRAHAVENAQKQGDYNVLPEIKPVRRAADKEGDSEGSAQLNLKKEQIQLIFKQYPVVAEAYNENVPELMDQGKFWSRFFNSRLLKKLKGEKIMHYDPPDDKLDKYLDRPERGPASVAHIPHFIDLEGNEQNHSQRKGNRPDLDMRPSTIDNVPILRILNNLSEKLMSHVAPEDGEAHAPIGIDEEQFEQLRLRDLAMNDVDNRIRLNIKEQQRYIGGDHDSLSTDAKLYAKQDPRTVLSTVRHDVQPSQLGADKNGTLRLDRAMGFESDEDSESDDEAASHQQENGMAAKKKSKTHVRVGSRIAIATASQTIFSSIKKRAQAGSADPNSRNGLSQTQFDNLVITQSTTTEFLHYFWTLFLSGDGSRAAELAQLVSTLDRSIDRINAVGKAAEAERQKKIDAIDKEIQDRFEKTRKKPKVDYDKYAPGGKKVVDAMVRPTLLAIEQATSAYQKALAEQTKEANES